VAIFVGRPAFVGAEAVLFDSAQEEKLPEQGTLTRVRVDFAGRAPASLDRGLELLIYVGDMALPRATARLAALVRAGGERPLNLRRRAGDRVRLVLRDTNGAWASSAPEITVSLTV
jgi:Ca-activated chloride channel family protein